MALKIIETADGSSTFYHEELDETYHSRHGALQEAKHVFIKMGLLPLLERRKEISILEIGFGTGLNAWLTACEANGYKKESELESESVLEREEEIKVKIRYVGVEAFPLSEQDLEAVNYAELTDHESEKLLLKEIQRCKWEEEIRIHPQFSLTKRKLFFSEIADVDRFDLIYFDAFGPRVQPDLWTVDIFKKMYAALGMGGVLVTYSAKGDVRRAMLEVGFKVAKVPGPPGKREMLVAKKGGNE
jgi:tRNA U34 5-methylaminomethyl-2-thiouridine-forming methyltransferase MnmC